MPGRRRRLPIRAPKNKATGEPVVSPVVRSRLASLKEGATRTVISQGAPAFKSGQLEDSWHQVPLFKGARKAVAKPLLLTFVAALGLMVAPCMVTWRPNTW